MKEKNLTMTVLFDFYGEILTEKQKQVIDLYYNDDLSLAEIAEQAQITRQGVRDCIKRAEATLSFMEEKLGLVRKFGEARSLIGEIRTDAAAIAEINGHFCFSRDIGTLADRIQEKARTLAED